MFQKHWGGPDFVQRHNWIKHVADSCISVIPSFLKILMLWKNNSTQCEKIQLVKRRCKSSTSTFLPPTGCDSWAARVQVVPLLPERQPKAHCEHIPGRWPPVGPGLLVPEWALHDGRGQRPLSDQVRIHGASPLCSGCASPWGKAPASTRSSVLTTAGVCFGALITDLL